MTMELQLVEADTPDKNSGSMASLTENGLVLWPVAFGESGEGLPYAPVDWPNPGDIWGWRVGKRKFNSGFMSDRYLYPPRRLQKTSHGKTSFASKQSVKEYIQKEFPDANVDAFFSLFSWKVPSKDHNWGKGAVGYVDRATFSGGYPQEEMAEPSGFESDGGTMNCKARNKTCSLQLETRSYALPEMECEICCLEPGFCRNCCCILCSRTIDWNYGGYSFIRCEAKINEGYICGHAAHIDCALRSYMAGTVGGSIGLDAEYQCRRCDQRTELISHVTNSLKICESLDSQDGIEKILKVGFCILRGSKQETAKWLLHRIELALAKLKTGVAFKDIWNMEFDVSAVSAGETSHLGSNGTLLRTLEITNDEDPLSITMSNSVTNVLKKSQQSVNLTLDRAKESSKLEADIDQVLQDLKNSQELEYRMAEERLFAQRDLLVHLYQQLDMERSELARRTSSSMNLDIDVLLTNISNRVNQIKQEITKFKEMEGVAKGFGRTSKDYILVGERFGVFFTFYLVRSSSFSQHW